MCSDIAISVRNLSKTYRIFGHPGDRLKQALTFGLVPFHREFTALQDVSFDIKKGETVGIVGRNGSGKSTLLQLLCGILKPSSGSVTVNGRISALLELGAGFNPEFTGRENVYFQGALMGFTKRKMDERFDDIAAFADIGEFIEQPVRMYSSGMYVRLAFAMAINVDPEILIVDEALAVGDIEFQAKCMTVFRRFSERGVTVLFVSHDMSSTRTLCNKAIYLNHGSMRAEGPSSEVVELYLRDMREVEFPRKRVPVMADEGNEDFEHRVGALRQGTGEVRVIAVELLDVDGDECNQALFGQSVRVRLHLYFKEAFEVAVTYHVRDDKHFTLIGSSSVLEGYGFVRGEAGARKIVEFTTTLPLTDGAYNILAILSVPVVVNRSARFVDYVENVVVFSVLERPSCKLWCKVYVENSLTVWDA